MYDIENYYNAETIKEAVTLLKEHPDARVISGGSDVLIKIREGKMAGTSLVSIRDIKEIKGILTGEAEPDYVRCVEISTAGAQHEMIWPSVLAVITPICMGIVFGVPGVFVVDAHRGLPDLLQQGDAALEGADSVIQNVKRRARGFRDMDYFATMIYLTCGKLDLSTVTT